MISVIKDFIFKCLCFAVLRLSLSVIKKSFKVFCASQKTYFYFFIKKNLLKPKIKKLNKKQRYISVRFILSG